MAVHPYPKPTVNSNIYGEFNVYLGATAVTGLSSFRTFLSNNGADSLVTVNTVEIGNGRYGYWFTPDAPGEWSLLITHAIYNPRGWCETFYVVPLPVGGGGGSGNVAARNAQGIRVYKELQIAHEQKLDTEDEEIILIASLL
jgi:hypothetical protein